jgi:uncharacterized membrane protein YeaQ/YmgE (transglycosylase-associated protein family)
MLFGLAVFLATGAVAGWLAGILMKGRGFGLVGNIIVGIVGSVIGGVLFDFLGIQPGGILGYVTAATIGAVSLLFLVALIKQP